MLVRNLSSWASATVYKREALLHIAQNSRISVGVGVLSRDGYGNLTPYPATAQRTDITQCGDLDAVCVTRARGFLPLSAHTRPRDFFDSRMLVSRPGLRKRAVQVQQDGRVDVVSVQFVKDAQGGSVLTASLWCDAKHVIHAAVAQFWGRGAHVYTHCHANEKTN